MCFCCIFTFRSQVDDLLPQSRRFCACQLRLHVRESFRSSDLRLERLRDYPQSDLRDTKRFVEGAAVLALSSTPWEVGLCPESGIEKGAAEVRTFA